VPRNPTLVHSCPRSISSAVRATRCRPPSPLSAAPIHVDDTLGELPVLPSLSLCSPRSFWGTIALHSPFPVIPHCASDQSRANTQCRPVRSAWSRLKGRIPFAFYIVAIHRETNGSNPVDRVSCAVLLKSPRRSCESTRCPDHVSWQFYRKSPRNIRWRFSSILARSCFISLRLEQAIVSSVVSHSSCFWKLNKMLNWLMSIQLVFKLKYD